MAIKLSAIRFELERLWQKGVFHSLIVVVGIQGVLFLQQVALTRVLAKDVLGQAIYVLRMITMVGMVADLGICTGVLKYVAEPIPFEKKCDYFRAGLLGSLISSSVVACVYAFAIFVSGLIVPDVDVYFGLLLASLYLPGLSVAKVPTLFLQGIKRVRAASCLSLAFTIVNVALVVAGAHLGGLNGFVLALVVAATIQAVAMVMLTAGYFIGHSARLIDARKVVGFGALSMCANFATFANASAGVLFLKWLGHSNEAVATLGVATYVYMAIRMLPQSLMQAAFPYLSGLLLDSHHFRKRVHEISLKQTFVVAACGLVFALVGRWCMPMIFGAQYANTYLPSLILLIGLGAWSAAAPFNQGLLIMSRVRFNLATSFFQLVCTVTCLFVLVPTMGTLGAAIAITTSTCVSSVIVIWWAERHLRLQACCQAKCVL